LCALRPSEINLKQNQKFKRSFLAYQSESADVPFMLISPICAFYAYQGVPKTEN
jgi:hypothetical protein